MCWKGNSFCRESRAQEGRNDGEGDASLSGRNASRKRSRIPPHTPSPSASSLSLSRLTAAQTTHQTRRRRHCFASCRLSRLPASIMSSREGVRREGDSLAPPAPRVASLLPPATSSKTGCTREPSARERVSDLLPFLPLFYSPSCLDRWCNSHNTCLVLCLPLAPLDSCVFPDRLPPSLALSLSLACVQPRSCSTS